MKRPAYESEPLPIALRSDQYAFDKLNYAHLVPLKNEELPLHTALNWLYSDDAKYHQLRDFGNVDYLPAKKFTIEVNPEEVLQSECITVRDSSELIEKMTIDLSGKNYVTKNEIAILSMIDGISREGWKRPIYFATTVGSEMYMGLNPYFRLVGLAYQIVPLAKGGTRSCDIDRTYDNLMNKFIWGNIQDTTIYLDENNRRMCRTQRMMFSTLIDELLKTGDKERALKATEYCDKTIPSETVPHDYVSLTMAKAYYECGKPEEGNKIILAIMDSNCDYLDWALSRISSRHLATIAREVRDELLTMHESLSTADQYDQQEIVEEYFKRFMDFHEKAQKNRIKVL